LSATRPAVFSAAEVVMKCFPSFSPPCPRPIPCHPEAPLFGAEGSMHFSSQYIDSHQCNR
jgi:hypothetical protein